jgi:hypothetical protein
MNEFSKKATFFFEKGSKTPLFCFVEETHSLHIRDGYLLFPEKEAKSVVLLRRRRENLVPVYWESGVGVSVRVPF